MRHFPKILSLCWALAAAASGASAQGWRGIVPLRSTRADVERLLGPGSCASHRCHYGTEGERVRVEYAKGPCEGDPSGWNVPADTVLALSVSFRRERPFSELGLDESRYEKDWDHTMRTHYSSREEGVQYTVLAESPFGGLKDVLETVRYVPSSGDSRLRCPCFPAEDDSIFRTRPVDEFVELSFEDSRARLDDFAYKLSQLPGWKGYVMVYAEKQTSPARAKSYARRFRKYLVGSRAVPAGKVTAAYGGYREYFGVELFIVSPTITPPRPRPTHAPCGHAAGLDGAGPLRDN